MFSDTYSQRMRACMTPAFLLPGTVSGQKALWPGDRSCSGSQPSARHSTALSEDLLSGWYFPQMPCVRARGLGDILDEALSCLRAGTLASPSFHVFPKLWEEADTQ